jgi:hypothetical protein
MKRNHNYYKMTRGRPCRARNEETSSTSIGGERSYSTGVRDSSNIDDNSTISNYKSRIGKVRLLSHEL